MSALPADAAESGEPTDFTTGVYSFLNALPEHMLRRLYSTPASSLAIFRSVSRHSELTAASSTRRGRTDCYHSLPGICS